MRYIIHANISNTHKFFASHISGGFLLDIGCGIKPYRELFVVEKYIGIDVEQSGHDHTHSKIDKFFDGINIPYEDNSFDYVIATEVFEHSFNLDKLLIDIRRVMKDDGVLFFTIPFCWNEHEIPFDFARYTRFGIAQILNENGFEITKIRKSTTFVETICQLLILYIVTNIFPRNKYIRTILSSMLTTPLTIIAKTSSLILPDDASLPLNLIVVARPAALQKNEDL